MGNFRELTEKLLRRKVFFSFDFDEDCSRAAVVRNSYVTKEHAGDNAGYIDKVEWEKLKPSSESVIKNWILRELEGTSVTVVLIGQYTSRSKWVNFEIEESIKRGNALLGIRINYIKNLQGQTSIAGNNPLDNHLIYDKRYGFRRRASDIYKTYDWVLSDGYNNFGRWVNEAKDIANDLISQSILGGLQYK